MHSRANLFRASALLLALAVPSLLPADTILNDFQVNTEFPGHPPQDSPYSVANWQTQRIYTTFLSQHDGTNWDVALARHNYDLQPVGQTTYLNVREGTYNCLRPKLVIRSSGVGAAWIEARNPNRIMFRSLDGNGNPTCPPVRIEDDFSNVPRDSLSIAALYDGFLLVWYDLRDSSKIWAQKVNLSGQLIGPNFPIQPDSTGSILGLEAQNHPDGRVLVSWVTNGQYSRGRWLDSLGNFMGEVFEMAEAWVDEYMCRSMVRFELEGTGLIYQYSDSLIVIPYAYMKFYYLTHLNPLGIQTSPRMQAGTWLSGYDDFMYHGYTVYSFPDLVMNPDSQFVSISEYYDHSWMSGSDDYDNCNILYSTLLGNHIVPWGLVGAYDLSRLNAISFLYTFDLEFIGLRKYQFSNLDSSEQIVWIGEPNFGAPQNRSSVCVHENGEFRVVYNNITGYMPQVYTKYFDAAGTPADSDMLISRDENLVPVMSEGGRIKPTNNGQTLVIWPHLTQLLGTTFAGELWSGNVNSYAVSPTLPLPTGIPNLDLNANGITMLIWRSLFDYYGEEGWIVAQLYSQAFQLFNYFQPSVAVSPVLPNDPLPAYEYDVAVKDDGRFLAAWCYGSFITQAGVNYHTLIGPPHGISTMVNCAPSLEKSTAGYWLAGTGPNGAMLQRIDSDGNLLGQAQIINEEDGIPIGDPALAVSASNNFAICWQDARNDSGDIYCRQFNPDGSFFGNEYRINSDPVGVMQKEPAVAFGPEDRLYFTWTDFRNPGGQGDIYCKVIEWEDALDAPVYQPPLPRAFALYPPSPNPFNAVTVLSFQLPVPNFVQLEVFDLAGRRVGAHGCAPLIDGWFEAGRHQVIFDGSDLASGIYIARLQAGKFTGLQKLVLLK